MTVLPVVAREMGVLARRKSMYWSRWTTAVLALLVMFWLLAVSSARISFAEMGRSIFFILSSLCFTFAVLVGMQATADSLSEEKREGTLGLLFLTDLKSFDIIAGKLAASSLQAGLALIGVIPMISLALLLGGVTLRQFADVALVLANTMFLSLAAGAFVSSLSRNERKAMVGTFVLLFIIVLGPWILNFALRQHLRFPEEILAASPLYNFAMIHSNPVLRPPGPGYFWQSLLGLHLLGWILLGLAAAILPKFVNELPSRYFRRVQEFADRFVYGRLEARKKHRAELLDQNAFLWLASRERVKPRYAWGILAFFIALHFWIASRFGDMVFDIAISTSLIFLIHLVFKIWAASEVCSRLIQDRRSGALELLLSTPLSVRQIGEGQTLALRRLFLKPIVVLLVLEAIMLYSGLRVRPTGTDRIVLYAALVGTFLADLWAVKWVGLWLSLTGKSIERVLLATITRVLILPWIVYIAAVGLFGLRIMLMGNSRETSSGIFGWGLLAICVSLTLGFAARQNFLAQFRELATKRFDSVPESEPVKLPEPKALKVKRPRTTLRSAIGEIFRRRPVVSSIVTLLMMLMLAMLARSEYWSYRLKKEIAAISTDGLPVTLSQASRYHPPPAPAENAFAMLHEFGMPIGRFVGRTRTGRAQMEPQALRLKNAETLLAANQAVLRAFWRLPRYARAHIDPFAPDLWQRQHQHMLYPFIAEADLIVLVNNPGAASLDQVQRDILSLLAHARLLRQQPLYFAQHSASQSLEHLASALEDVLKADLLDEKTLGELIDETKKLHDPDALTRTLIVQRAQFLDPPPNPFGGGALLPPPPLAARFQSALANLLENLGGRDKLTVEILEDYEAALALSKAPYPRRPPQNTSNEHRRRWYQQTLNPVAGPVMPLGYIPDLLWADCAFVANLHLIQTALALECYQRRHAKLPADLAALVPEFLPSVPIDPYTGKPLSLLRSSDALLIYSVGMDLQDDSAASAAGTPRLGPYDVVFTFR